MDISGVRHSINAQLLDALQQAGTSQGEQASALATNASTRSAIDAGAGRAASDPGETLLALDPWPTGGGTRALPQPSEVAPEQRAPEALAEFVVAPAINAVAAV